MGSAASPVRPRLSSSGEAFHTPVLAAGWPAKLCLRLSRQKSEVRRRLLSDVPGLEQNHGHESLGYWASLSHRKGSHHDTRGGGQEATRVRPQGFAFDHRRRLKDGGSSQKQLGLFSLHSSVLDVVLHGLCDCADPGVRKSAKRFIPLQAGERIDVRHVPHRCRIKRQLSQQDCSKNS